ncbi:hypothetical protein ACFX5Q_24755 [Mesorhizobium sp. IMUNJ 23033]|uniref:hypothetical protein n=1 Tax=Mesorhizobium sp. IMUNJ 23033 TaxID=3378039 RepID=UPI00384F0632
MTRKQKRLSVIGGALAFLGAATMLTFVALGQKTTVGYRRRFGVSGRGDDADIRRAWPEDVVLLYACRPQ